MKSKLNNIPFLRLIVPFVSGIIIQERAGMDEDIILIVFISLAVLFILLLISGIPGRFRLNPLFGILGYGILFSGGMKLTVQNELMPGSAMLRSGLVLYIPEEREKTFRIIIGKLREKMPGGWSAVDGKALVYLRKTDATNALEPGDMLLFYGPLQTIERPANPLEFDFGKYCRNLGIFWKTYPADNEWKRLNNKRKIFSLPGAEWIRLRLVRFIQSKNLENESLVNSLLLGYRDGLTGEQQKYFAASGAMHILAVSGMHVGIIYGALVFVFQIFFRRKTGFVLLIPLPVVWLYAFITGMTPSVVRSAIMISLYVISRFLNRRVGALNIIFASGFFMIISEPAVIHLVSFQLSFAAVAGIAVAFHRLYGRIKTGIRIVDQLISFCCLSICAQLFTFPLSVYYFHQFPDYFLITNLFAVPLSGIILIAGFIFFLSFFSMPLSSILAVILDKITGLLDHLTRITGTLPFATSANLSLDPYQVIGLYLVILLLFQFFRTRKVLYFHLSLAGIVLILGGICHEMIRQSDKKEIVVLSVRGHTAVNLIHGTKNLVVTDDTASTAKSGIISCSGNFWCSMRLDDPEFILLQDNENGFRDNGMMLAGSFNSNLHWIQFCNSRIGILDGRIQGTMLTKIPLKLDLLVIGLKSRIRVSEFRYYLSPDLIIIDVRTPARIAEEIENECIEYGILCYNIHKKGCFKLEL